jgi:hypothetical protein
LTEHRTAEGKLYLCAIKDLWSNKIVGWAISERMKARIVVAAVEMAVERRGDVAGCVLHSDRGSQFRARKVHLTLAQFQMVGSMGQVGTAADNAAMESFLALLQKNVLNTRRWATRDQLRVAIVTLIERTYHQRRRQQRLGRSTPTEYESIMTPPAALAALTKPDTSNRGSPNAPLGTAQLLHELPTWFGNALLLRSLPPIGDRVSVYPLPSLRPVVVAVESIQSFVESSHAAEPTWQLSHFRGVGLLDPVAGLLVEPLPVNDEDCSDPANPYLMANAHRSFCFDRVASLTS